MTDARICPACGSAGEVPAGLIVGVDGRTYRLGTCPGCGLRSVSDPPGQEVLQEHYSGSYYAQTVLRRLPLSFQVKRRLEESDSPLAARVLRSLSIARLPAPRATARRMLDVGCGDGATMLRAERLGWRPEGCEISDRACSLVRVRGFTCHAGDWWLSLPDAAYGFVHMHHVLEHLPDPAAALDGVRRSMTDRALLLIGLPNWECSMAAAFGPAWWANKAPEHLRHYEYRHVRRMLRDRGLRVDRVLMQNVLLGSLRPDVVRAQWRTARAARWSRARIVVAFAWGLRQALVHRLAGTGPATGEGFAYVLECSPEGP